VLHILRANCIIKVPHRRHVHEDQGLVKLLLSFYRRYAPLMVIVFLLLFNSQSEAPLMNSRSNAFVPNMNIGYLPDRWYSSGHAFLFQFRV
jgi:hypothetical protein